MQREPDVWGEIRLGEPGAVTALTAGRILGVRLARDEQGKPAAVGVQWLDERGHPVGLTMSFLDAIALLANLKAMQLDLDAPFPEDPRDPSWRVADYKPRRGS
jgi:hypothetical protein